MNLLLAGDVLPDATPDPFRRIAGALASADLLFCNLETPLSRRGAPIGAKLGPFGVLPGEFLFRAKPEAARQMAHAGFDIVSLANNHALDYGPVALGDTLDVLARNQIAVCGAARRIGATWLPTVVERHGVRVAFLGYVTSDTCPPGYGRDHRAGQPGVALLEVGPEPDASAATGAQLSQDLQRARRLADIVVVSFHWGVERSVYPTRQQQALGHMAVDLGADLVVGHHPHCLQGVELYRGHPVLYSLGNFVFPGRDHLVRRTALARVRLTRSGIQSVTLLPAYLNGNRPVLITGRSSRVVAERLNSLSTSLGNQLEIRVGSGVASACMDLTALPRSGSAFAARNPPPSPDLLVPVDRVVSAIAVDLRYATPNNAFGRPLYGSHRAYLRYGTALKLAAAQRGLAPLGLRLKLWDAYRPLSVQRQMWTVKPDRQYVADPRHGSDHNRGAAVDVTLIGWDGRELPMPTDFDAFGLQAWAGSLSNSTPRGANGLRLRRIMLANGFCPLDTEWWHFADVDAKRYPILDVPLGPSQDLFIDR